MSYEDQLIREMTTDFGEPEPVDPNQSTETDGAKREVKSKGMTDRLLYAWVNGKPAPNDMQFPDKS